MIEVVVFFGILGWGLWRMLRSYVPPVCRRCRHLVPEHRWGSLYRTGQCHRWGCPCPQYVRPTTRRLR